MEPTQGYLIAGHRSVSSCSSAPTYHAVPASKSLPSLGDLPLLFVFPAAVFDHGQYTLRHGVAGWCPGRTHCLKESLAPLLLGLWFVFGSALRDFMGEFTLVTPVTLPAASKMPT